jgi:hypothetical protein
VAIAANTDINLHLELGNCSIARGPITAIFVKLELEMLQDTRVPTLASASRPSDSSPLFPIAMFSGTGLLMSLVAIILGFHATWL